MPRFSTGQIKEPDKLNQRFSFTGKIRGSDVLLRLVEACGYEVVREALNKLKPEPALKPVAPPALKRPARAPAGGRKGKSSD